MAHCGPSIELHGAFDQLNSMIGSNVVPKQHAAEQFDWVPQCTIAEQNAGQLQ